MCCIGRKRGTLVNAIKKGSFLNKLKHFKVACPGLAPCIGHDMWEGVVAVDLMLATKYFI